MKVIVVKDGTVPVVVGKVWATDFGPDGALAEDVHEYAEVFEVADDTTALFVGWTDFEGFQVSGFTDLNLALRLMNEGASEKAIAESNIDGRHWSVTYNEDDEDHETYGHVFWIGEAA